MNTTTLFNCTLSLQKMLKKDGWVLLKPGENNKNRLKGVVLFIESKIAATFCFSKSVNIFVKLQEGS